MVSRTTIAMSYECPVCGFDELAKPPEDFSICECCGTEFESDDFDRSHAELRHDWISNNMLWFSRSVLAPKNWSPFRQLIIADHGRDLITHPRFKDELEYRSEVNKAFSEVFISKQLKALREREAEPLTQTQLANKAGMKQSRISELEGMNYSSWSISTLERLAKALGVAFTYSFEAWRDLVSRMEQGLSAEVLAIPSFDRDTALTDHGIFIKHGAHTLEALYGEPVESYTGLRLRPYQLASDEALRAALSSAVQSIRIAESLSRFVEHPDEHVIVEDELFPAFTSIGFSQTSASVENVTSLAIN
jgi:transcriptional regulator with XRE-family HTH domain